MGIGAILLIGLLLYFVVKKFSVDKELTVTNGKGGNSNSSPQKGSSNFYLSTPTNITSGNRGASFPQFSKIAQSEYHVKRDR